MGRGGAYRISANFNGALTGNVGVAYGGGASGTTSSNNNANSAGAAGALGVAIFTEFA